MKSSKEYHEFIKLYPLYPGNHVMNNVTEFFTKFSGLALKFYIYRLKLHFYKRFTTFIGKHVTYLKMLKLIIGNCNIRVGYLGVIYFLLQFSVHEPSGWFFVYLSIVEQFSVNMRVN